MWLRFSPLKPQRAFIKSGKYTVVTLDCLHYTICLYFQDGLSLSVPY